MFPRSPRCGSHEWTFRHACAASAHSLRQSPSWRSGLRSACSPPSFPGSRIRAHPAAKPASAPHPEAERRSQTSLQSRSGRWACSRRVPRPPPRAHCLPETIRDDENALRTPAWYSPPRPASSCERFPHCATRERAPPAHPPAPRACRTPMDPYAIAGADCVQRLRGTHALAPIFLAPVHLHTPPHAGLFLKEPGSRAFRNTPKARVTRQERAATATPVARSETFGATGSEALSNL